MTPTYDLLGVFLQDVVPAGKRTDVHLGGRYTYAAAEVGRAQDPVTGEAIQIDDSWHNFSASGRVIHRLPDERLRVFAGVFPGVPRAKPFRPLQVQFRALIRDRDAIAGTGFGAVCQLRGRSALGGRPRQNQRGVFLHLDR